MVGGSTMTALTVEADALASAPEVEETAPADEGAAVAAVAMLTATEPPVPGAVATPAHASAAAAISARVHAVISPPVRRTTRLLSSVLGVGEADLQEDKA